MAHFSDESAQIETPRPAAPAPQGAASDHAESESDRPIGDFLCEIRNLSAAQVEQVLAYQRDKGVRFGEAAIALRLASTDDVLYALAQQFRYPYTPESSSQLAPEVVALSQPFSPQAEAFRVLRSQVMMRVFARGQAAPRALALISPDSGDGKSYVAANLAVVLAQLGGRTLLIDADMRNPRQHDIFKLTVKSGLSGALSGRAEKQAVQQVSAIPSLFVLPVGAVPPNPLELVERPAFGLLVRELATQFDHVLVDTPAAALGSDGQVIAARCGAALGLARKNQSRVRALKVLGASIAQTPAELVGFIVNEH
jgi:chain length determinant protein tyrosine kinase EpsG